MDLRTLHALSLVPFGDPIVLAFLASAVREHQGVSLWSILPSAGPAVQSPGLAVSIEGKFH